jgi:SAM-dependent methyltransferase
MAHKYDPLFFDYIERGARSSAKKVSAHLTKALGIDCVLDVGCGRGVWLSEWLASGVSQVQGVDGAYVERTSLAIPNENFRATDITEPFDFGRHFDLVQCLEVGEHVPPDRSEMLVDNIVRHGRVVLFSAATPGQGGEFHVNEQKLSFWRDLFRRHDYHPFDYIRPLVTNDRDVEPWYRYNALLYVHSQSIPLLPQAVAATRIPERRGIPDVAPLGWKLRCAVLRRLPVSIVTRLSVILHRVVVMLSKRDVASST